MKFLDNDDQFFPNHVGVLADKLRRRPDLAAAYALSLAVRTSLRSLDPLVYSAYPGHPFRVAPFRLARLVNGNFLPIQSVMFRRELFLRHGGFDVELAGRAAQGDWDLWTRYFAAGRAEFVPETTSFFRVRRPPPNGGTARPCWSIAQGRHWRSSGRRWRPGASRPHTRQFVGETERFGLLQVPLPSGVRRWIAGSRLPGGWCWRARGV